MLFDFTVESDCDKARYRLEKLISSQSKVEMTKKQNTRSSAQNRALHKLFTNIAEQLNELGETFNHLWQDEIVEIPYTPELIKETLWKTVQMALFNKASTTEINTEELNQVLDVITLKFGEMGIPIVFPNRMDYLIEQELKTRL